METIKQMLTRKLRSAQRVLEDQKAERERLLKRCDVTIAGTEREIAVYEDMLELDWTKYADYTLQADRK